MKLQTMAIRSAWRGALGLGFLVAGMNAASAQTWSSVLKPPNSSCPTGSLSYAFTLSGNELSVKAPTGDTYRGAVAADGKVTIQYQSTAQMGGKVTISGNARTRELQLVNSGLPNCAYSLVAAAEPASSAFQGTVGNWAIGRWRGNRSYNLAGRGLVNAKQSLIVEKRPDGKVVCIWIDTEFEQGAAAAPQCTITANAITLTSAAGNPVALSLSASTGTLSGLVRDVYGSSQISLARQ